MDILCAINGICVRASSDAILWNWNNIKDNLWSKAYGPCFHFNYPKKPHIELIGYYLKYCSCVTYPLTVSLSLLWAVNISNIFSCTSQQFTILSMTWNDFTPYSILFTYVDFRLVFQPWRIRLGVKSSHYWLNNTLGYLFLY